MRLRPFFQDSNRQDQLWQAAKRWEGTPFFPNNASIGHGVGCVDLCHELWCELGATERMTLPHYSLDWGQHCQRSQLLQFLLTAPELAGRLQFVPVLEESMPGDLIALKSGHVDHHLACALSWGKFVHAHSEYGVQILDQSERTFADRRLYTLRLFEESNS